MNLGIWTVYGWVLVAAGIHDWIVGASAADERRATILAFRNFNPVAGMASKDR
jgi:hypothetical protein